MPKKIYKAEEIINLLRQIEMLISQGQTAQAAARGERNNASADSPISDWIVRQAEIK